MLSPFEIMHFWSGIMRDHAELHLMNLSFRETEFIKTAQFYKNAFINIGKESEAAANTPASTQALANKIFPILTGFINFKRLITQKLLQCDIELGLTPTFINHMINEALEFHRDLCSIVSNIQMNPIDENILLHKIWLRDASGHAASIAADLDETEASLIQEAKEFKKAFDNLFIKSVELGQMLERTCLQDGSLEWLNKEVESKINEFICFLDKIKTLRESCKALGTIKPFIPDHMIREEKYYLANVQRLKSRFPSLI